MKKLNLLYALLICFIANGCNQHSDKIPEPQKYPQFSISGRSDLIILEDDNKPLGIGDIYLGIDESTFNYKRAEFLANHPTLGNLTINTMDGEFEDGKLCCITINSTDRIIDLCNHYRNLNFYGWKKMYENKYYPESLSPVWEEMYGVEKMDNVIIEKGKYSIFVYEETDCMDFADWAKTIHETMEKQNELNLRFLSNRNHVYDTVHSQIIIFDNSIDILKIVRRKKTNPADVERRKRISDDMDLL